MRIGIVGLGYVGLPLAVAFAQKYDVIGFDINEEKIKSYKKGKDFTNEVGDKIKNVQIEFTSKEEKLRTVDFIIIAVPTPIDEFKKPDFLPLKSASSIVGRNLKKGGIVVYESTVYPGATEEICIPILERDSEMKCGVDFKVGYSPERVNPGDKTHRVENIIKIVSAIDEESLEIISNIYGTVITAGIYKASSIKVAEAAKILENTQRDINIAFMNEVSVLFKKLGINTMEIIEAASTKWNFLRFTPGLVGGHCIGVDPYYLIEKAKNIGFDPKLMKVAREVNDNIPQLIADDIELKIKNLNIENSMANIAILGLTFKENVPDTRNSKAMEIVEILKEKSINVVLSDPLVEIENYNMKKLDEIKDMDIIVFAVAHDKYKNITPEEMKNMLRISNGIIYDLKNIFSEEKLKEYGLLKISL